MTRNEFMWSLNNALAGLPQNEIKRISEYYDELFSEALDEGKTEDEVCASLEKPSEIAERVRVELAFVRAEQSPTPKSMNAVLLIIIGLFALPIGFPIAIALASVVFAMFIAVVAVIFALGCTTVALAVSGVGCVAAGVWAMFCGGPLLGLALTGAGLVLFGLGLAGGVGSGYLLRACMKGITKLCRSIYNAIKGIGKKERRHESV